MKTFARLWFWPAILGLLAAAAAEGLVRVDRALDQEGARPLWVFSGNADAARCGGTVGVGGQASIAVVLG